MEKVVNITRIEQVTGRHYTTLIRWKRDLNFPMFKEGGQWVLIMKDYTDWQKAQAEGETYVKKRRSKTKD